MPLNAQQKKLIVNVDNHVKTRLANGGHEETLLVDLLDYMPGIKTIIDVAPDKELDLYLQGYPGFYHYMKVLEKLAQGIAQGTILVPR